MSTEQSEAVAKFVADCAIISKAIILDMHEMQNKARKLAKRVEIALDWICEDTKGSGRMCDCCQHICRPDEPCKFKRVYGVLDIYEDCTIPDFLVELAERYDISIDEPYFDMNELINDVSFIVKNIEKIENIIESIKSDPIYVFLKQTKSSVCSYVQPRFQIELYGLMNSL
jgi:hypothetical protein